VTEIDGSPLENAFWNGQAVFYGNAGKNFKPLAGALDVTAHELGHGVVSNTANLDYYGQSGSINETYADIFASMVDRDDWLIGEDVTKTEYSPSGALRNMADPHNMGDNTKIYWQPKHITEMYLGNDDSKGVHINSGIGNHVYYLFASAIGKDKAEKVFYRALTEYLTKTSQFINFKIAVIQSAVDLYGADSPEAIKAGEAFDAVGIYDEEIVDDNQVFAVNPGDEFLFSYDTKISDPVSLYLSTAEGTGYSPMSKTSMMGKVSVTDDGSRAVFVSTDHRIRMISTDPLNTNEQIISGYAFYDNIAISKDGKRLAVTKIYADASIYVIDLESGKGTRFILYNPTTGQFNTNTGGVLYADALEFDVTGEYLIYDACNAISSKTQEDIYYWDIGFIKVWDNNKQNFGNGSISKLFNTLPDNISIANPVFSNNSPFIIAFDGFSSVGFTEEFGVYAANFETGEIKKIIDNDRLGYPSFSRNDNRIAYSATNIFGMQVVESIKLASDKITSRGDPGVLVPDAKWPVYFATGNRALGLPPGANFIADYRYGDAPLKVKYIDISTNNPTSWQWTFQGGTPSSSNEQFPVVTYEAPGTYKVSMEATNYIGSNTISKEGYIIVSGATGIDDLEINTLLYYPNPVSDFLTIGFNDDFSVRIYNLQGELLLTRENEPKLDLSSMNPGIYIMELETKNELSRHKLMKE
jgi:PKD repeat protein